MLSLAVWFFPDIRKASARILAEPFLMRVSHGGSAMTAQKGRYFSVRFSASLLDRLEAIRMKRYGARTTLAETIRRLLEDQLNILETKSYNHSSVVVGGTDDRSNSNALKGPEVDALLGSLPSELSPIALAIERLTRVIASAALAPAGSVHSPPLPVASQPPR